MQYSSKLISLGALSGNKAEEAEKKRRLPLVNRVNYFKIWGFMRFDLNLEKTELLVYAIIFSYYYQRCDSFVGTREYLAQWTGSSRSTIDDALRSLLKKGYIEKGKQKIGGVERCYYTVDIRTLPKCAMFEIENKSVEMQEKIERASGKI